MKLRVLAVIGIPYLLSSCLVAQQAAAGPTFAVADVHPASPSSARFMRGGTLHGSRFEVRSASMADLISFAYTVDIDKVLAGPSWLELDRFDIVALTQGHAEPEAVNQMLQGLLAERFHLVVKQESRPMPAYALTVGKKLQIKESDGAGEPGCKQTLVNNGGRGAPDAPVVISSLIVTMSCKSVSLDTLTQRLPIPRKPGEPNRPVIDQTGLKGLWSFDFKFSLGGVPGETASIFDELEKQLGLKLEETKSPMPVVDVKSVSRTPTANSAEAMKLFPVLPLEFDVGEIKPSKPTSDSNNLATTTFAMRGGGVAMGRAGRGGPGSQLQNGRLNLKGQTLKNLIMLAWDLTSPDSLTGVPKWMDTDPFDVVAKVPDGAADAFTDMDSIKPMLRKLLLDSFRMTVHNEERPLPGYVLTAVKPKLKPADPAGRTRCTNGPGADGKDPRNGNTAMSRLVTCQNMTITQFADLLPNIAGGYLPGTTVVDQTNLAGAFDFTFYFSPAPMMIDGGRGAVRVLDNNAGAAADPTGGITLFDAMTKLLGLKLEMQKRSLPALVIDHAEPKPIDN